MRSKNARGNLDTDPCSMSQPTTMLMRLMHMYSGTKTPLTILILGIIIKNVNEVWGTRDWTIPINMQIEALSDTRGKIGTVTVITKISKKKFMERWKSLILAYQVMALLMPEAQASLKNPQESILVDRSTNG